MAKHIAMVSDVLRRNQFVGSTAMPVAEALVIEEAPGGGFMLVRYTRAREFAGDTWHASIDDAFHQANYEFGALDWRSLPDEAE